MAALKRFGLFALPLLLCLWTAAALAGGPAPEAPAPPWRIRFLEAAIVRGDTVLLGEIAVPAGDIPPAEWAALAARRLWPSPDEGGKPMHMTRPRMQEAVMQTMRDLAPWCLFPPSMAVQRGGALIGKEDVRRLVESELAPRLAALPGEAQLSDYRLPPYVFLSHAGQRLELEAPRKVAAGRLSLRLLALELDGSVKQKLTGSVFVDCWANVPVASVIMNKEELLEHDKVAFRRVNLASLRGEPWDGRGGPWRLARPVAEGQVLYKADLAHIPTVRKGSRVTLVYEGKTVRLTVHAEALTDGSAGETIPVRNSMSRKEVFGMVLDSATVVVRAAS